MQGVRVIFLLHKHIHKLKIIQILNLRKPEPLHKLQKTMAKLDLFFKNGCLFHCFTMKYRADVSIIK